MGGELRHAPLDHLGDRWRRHVLQGRTINANNYEAAAFEALKDGLRSGDLFVLGSHRYRSFESYLLAKDRWNELRAAGETRLALTMTAQEYIADRHKQITDLLTGLHRDFADLPWISVDAQGKLHLAAFKADTPPKVKAVRQRVYRKLPRIPLTELLRDVDATTGCFDHCTHLSTGEIPRGGLRYARSWLCGRCAIGAAHQAGAGCPYRQGPVCLRLRLW